MYMKFTWMSCMLLVCTLWIPMFKRWRGEGCTNMILKVHVHVRAHEQQFYLHVKLRDCNLLHLMYNMSHPPALPKNWFKKFRWSIAWKMCRVCTEKWGKNVQKKIGQGVKVFYGKKKNKFYTKTLHKDAARRRCTKTLHEDVLLRLSLSTLHLRLPSESSYRPASQFVQTPKNKGGQIFNPVNTCTKQKSIYKNNILPT